MDELRVAAASAEATAFFLAGAMVATGELLALGALFVVSLVAATTGSDDAGAGIAASLSDGRV